MGSSWGESRWTHTQFTNYIQLQRGGHQMNVKAM